MSSVDKLRLIDAEILQHVIARGKLWEKRKKIIKSISASSELSNYQAELAEWLEEMKTQPEGQTP